LTSINREISSDLINVQFCDDKYAANQAKEESSMLEN